MITKKKLTIPIFEVKLTVVIFDNFDEVKYLAGDTASKGFITYSDDFGSILVGVRSDRPDTIAHESEHIKNVIWRYIGYESQEDNDEVDAYLVGYIYNRIASVLFLDNSSKGRL